MIVLKFGGTSVKDASQMKRVLSIIKKRLNQPQLVVLSACSGTTDNLTEVTEHAARGDIDFSLGLARQIRDRHIGIAKDLISDNQNLENAISEIDKLISKLNELIEGISILKECTDFAHSKCLAFGEYLSTALFYHYCKTAIDDCKLMDSSKLIRVKSGNKKESVDIETTRKLVAESIDGKNSVTIVQGFIASNTDGKLTTFNRGGSDYSATIYGVVLNAKQIEIWTDVSGVLSADPGLISKAKTIEKMPFDEVRELSFYGAKVLHPETIKPAMQNNIPVKILNTNKSDEKGTTILSEDFENGSVSSLILNSHCPVITSYQKSLSDQLIKKINNYIINNDLRVLFNSISDKKIFYLFDKNTNKNSFGWILKNFDVKVKSYDMIVLCGNRMKITGGLLAALDETADKEFKGIFYGHSDYSLFALYSVGYGINALKHLHKQLIEK